MTFTAARETPIQPLIPDLAFIEDRQRWGFPFRRGPFRIERADAARIAAAMGVQLDDAPWLPMARLALLPSVPLSA